MELNEASSDQLELGGSIEVCKKGLTIVVVTSSPVLFFVFPTIAGVAALRPTRPKTTVSFIVDG